MRFQSIFGIAAVSVLLAACGSSGSTGVTPVASTPAPTPTPQLQRLYVGDGSTSGALRVYALPLTANATPVAQVSTSNTIGLAVNASYAAVLDNASHVTVFAQPLTSSSTPIASFTTPSGFGHLLLSTSNTLYAANEKAAYYQYTLPFTNSSTPSTTSTVPGYTQLTALAFNQTGGIIVDDGASGTFTDIASSVTVVAPSGNNALRGITSSATQLFIASVLSPGKVLVYNLPLTASSAPVATITNGMNAPEDVAVDNSGNLYVGNINDGTVKMYAPPFSNTSAPAVSLTTPAGIFSIAVAP